MVRVHSSTRGAGVIANVCFPVTFTTFPAVLTIPFAPYSLTMLPPVIFIIHFGLLYTLSCVCDSAVANAEMSNNIQTVRIIIFFIIKSPRF